MANRQSPPPTPADAEVVRNIEVLAAFVAKTGAQFEQLARVNTAGDPKFAFLLGDGPPGSEAALSHAFYEWKKKRLEQRVFATDGSDDLQLKICAMVDEARTSSKSETHALSDKSKPFLLGTAEEKKIEAKAATVQKTESRLCDHSKSSPDHTPLLHRGQGDAKLPLLSTPTKRKAESVSTGNALKKATPLGGLLSLSHEPKGDLHKRRHVIPEHAQKPEDDRNSPNCGPSDEARIGGDTGSAETKERNSKEIYGLRLLKSALADYVKEALKPVWKEGSMSKEDFKSIVKKVVDKVIGSLQAHQIPKSQENVDQYMAQSETKISKLVQGYVDRFKKN